MKNKFLYIFFSFVVLITSSGFGFLESSTIMNGRENRQFKSDSLKIASSHLQFSNNSSLLKKEIDKPGNSQISKSFIQWTANLVKNTVQILVDVIVEAARVILVTIIQFFIG